MDLLNTLLEISIYSGIIFFAVMLIKKIFKNMMSPFLHYVIWALFILRLIIPVTFETPMHFITYPAQTLPSAEQTGNTSNTVNALAFPVTSSAQSATIQSNNYHASESTSKNSNQPTDRPASLKIRFTTSQILLSIWLLGTGIGLTYIVILSILLTRKIKHKSAPASAHLLKLLDEIKNELGIKTKLKLVCQYEYGTPALLFPRTILIPMDALSMMDDDQIKNCIRHECMHHKRGDHLISLVLTLLNTVYWFNPFMWLAYSEIRKDMEIACDSNVVKRMNASERRSYAVLILDLCGQTRHMQIALGMSQAKKAAEQRIKGVFMAHKTKRSVKLISVMLAAVMLVCCFTTACQPTPEEDIVVAKGDNQKQLASNTSESNSGENGAHDDLWSDSFMAKDDQTEIEISAEINKPSICSFFKATVTPTVLDSDEIESLADVLFEGQPVYDSDSVTPTKADIAEKIVQIKKNIEDLKNGIYPSSMGEKATVYPEDIEYALEWEEEQLEKYTKEYENAPETASGEESNFEYVDENDVGIVDVEGNLGKSAPAGLTVVSQDNRGFMEFINWGGLKYYVGAKVESPDDTIDQYKTVSDDLLDSLGFDEVYSTGVYSVSSSTNENDVASQEDAAMISDAGTNTDSNTNCYTFKYSKLINEMEVNAVDNFLGNGEMSESTYSDPIEQETIDVMVEDGKVIGFKWYGVSETSGITDVNLLSDNEIKERAKAQLQIQSFDASKYEQKTININEMKLGLIVVSNINSNNGFSAVPVWDFYGYETVEEKIFFDQIKFSYLTLNAIDGSVVNRNLGY